MLKPIKTTPKQASIFSTPRNVPGNRINPQIFATEAADYKAGFVPEPGLVKVYADSVWITVWQPQ